MYAINIPDSKLLSLKSYIYAAHNYGLVVSLKCSMCRLLKRYTDHIHNAVRYKIYTAPLFHVNDHKHNANTDTSDTALILDEGSHERDM